MEQAPREGLWELHIIVSLAFSILPPVLGLPLASTRVGRGIGLLAQDSLRQPFLARGGTGALGGRRAGTAQRQGPRRFIRDHLQEPQTGGRGGLLRDGDS